MLDDAEIASHDPQLRGDDSVLFIAIDDTPGRFCEFQDLCLMTHTYMGRWMPYSSLAVSCDRGVIGALLALQHRKKVILLDHDMPGWTGLIWVEWLIAHVDPRTIPVIIVSTTALKGVREEMFRRLADSGFTVHAAYADYLGCELDWLAHGHSFHSKRLEVFNVDTRLVLAHHAIEAVQILVNKGDNRMIGKAMRVFTDPDVAGYAIGDLVSWEVVIPPHVERLIGEIPLPYCRVRADENFWSNVPGPRVLTLFKSNIPYAPGHLWKWVAGLQWTSDLLMSLIGRYVICAIHSNLTHCTFRMSDTRTLTVRLCASAQDFCAGEYGLPDSYAALGPEHKSETWWIQALIFAVLSFAMTGGDVDAAFENMRGECHDG